MTNAEIADALDIAPKTASSHVEHILAKLGVTRRAEIAAWTANITRPAPTPAGSAAGGTAVATRRGCGAAQGQFGGPRARSAGGTEIADHDSPA